MTATRSTSSRLTVSTIASTYGRLMVGPTWTSLTWAIVKPSSAAGRPAIGTSTRTTRATRRALAKPQSVTSTAAIATARADGVTSDAGDSAPGQSAAAPVASRRPTSRTAVRTNSDENSPMQTRPIQASAAAPRPAPPRRAPSPYGSVSAETSRSTASATAPAGESSPGTRRQPT